MHYLDELHNHLISFALIFDISYFLAAPTALIFDISYFLAAPTMGLATDP
jgi:hypothetical protein